VHCFLVAIMAVQIWCSTLVPCNTSNPPAVFQTDSLFSLLARIVTMATSQRLPVTDVVALSGRIACSVAIVARRKFGGANSWRSNRQVVRKQKWRL